MMLTFFHKKRNFGNFQIVPIKRFPKFRSKAELLITNRVTDAGGTVADGTRMTASSPDSRTRASFLAAASGETTGDTRFLTRCQIGPPCRRVVLG